MQDITKEKLFLLIPIFAIIIVAIIIYIYYIQRPKLEHIVNHQLPQISAPELLSSNKQFSNSLLKHHIELITFWNSKCDSCQEQQNLLMFIANAHMIAIYGVDSHDTSKNAKKFLIKHGNPFKAIAVDKNGRIGLMMGINSIPETLLVNDKGAIRDDMVGPITSVIWFDKLKPEIEKLKKQEHL